MGTVAAPIEGQGYRRGRGYWFAVMVGFCVLLCCVSLVLDLTPDDHRPVELVMAFGGWGIVAAAWAFRHRAGSRFLAVVAVPAIVLLTSAGLYLSGDPANPAPAFAIPMMVYSFFFFPRRVASVHLAFASVCFSVAMLLGPDRSTAADHLMFGLGTAALTGVVIARLRDRLVEQMRSDWLTGVLNRGGFDARLKRAVAEAQASERPLALLLADVDDFKQINDAGGHVAGDEALRTLARALVAVGGPANVGRLGGDEFAVLFPGATAGGAHGHAAELRSRLALAGFSGTVSVGVASLAASDADADHFLGRADEALYSAKRGGRGGVASAPDPLAALRVVPPAGVAEPA